MRRPSVGLFVGMCLMLTGALAPVPDSDKRLPRGVASDEIKQAIDDLGNKSFAVRERARKFLVNAGAAAEPFLERAAKSSDAEVSNAAQTILNEFQWGLYPDTPQKVRDCIEKFRSGTPEQRQLAVLEMFKTEPAQFRVTRKLLNHENDATPRGQMFANLCRQALAAAPGLLESGDSDAVKEKFEFLLADAPEDAAPHYAALMYFRGNLDAAIAKFEKQRQQKGEDGRRAAEILVRLYRNNGDFPNARKAAHDAQNDHLLGRVLWQAGDWKGLTNTPSESDGQPDVEAAYARLAGDKKKFDEKIAAIIQSADEAMDDSSTLHQSAHALLFNGKESEAIRILADKKKAASKLFELLCVQSKSAEALELVDEDGFGRVRRARMLYLLGKKDQAIEMFQGIAANLKNSRFGDELIKAEMSVGRSDLALEHAAKALAPFRRRQPEDRISSLLNTIFGDDAAHAATWLSIFPNDEPRVVMRRVSAILSGKLDRKQLDAFIDEALNEHHLKAEEAAHFENVDAVAAAYNAIGDQTKADEYLKFASQKKPTFQRYLAYGDFLMRDKKFKDAALAYDKAAKLPPAETSPENVVGSAAGEFNPALAAYMRGRALMLGGQANEGKKSIELAHWLPLGNDGLRAKLVVQLIERNWPEMADKEAEMVLKTGLNVSVVYIDMLYFIARRAARIRDYSKAADYYERCMVGIMRIGSRLTDPANYLLLPVTIRNSRALVSLAEGRIDEALKQTDASLEIVPGNVELANSMIPELERLGKKKEADAMYQKLLNAREKFCADYPNSPYAHSTAALLMATCRRDLDSALKHAKKAAELEPTSGDCLSALAEVHFRKGNRDAAIAVMKQCVDLDPKRVFFRSQLARFKDQSFDSLMPLDPNDD